MMEFLRLLRGYVTFIISGSFPQRFINCCRKEKLPIWDIKPKSNGIEAKTYADTYKKFRRLRKNKSPKLKIKSKHGISFSLNPYKNRPGFIIGALLSFALIYFLTSRIWLIKVNSNDASLNERIISELASIGIEKGIKRDDIDVKDIRRKLMLLENDIAWDGINIKGSKMSIEISKAKKNPPKEFERQKHADLIASSDGQIIYIETDRGMTLCKKGDTVAKGDILVSGTMTDKYGGIRCVYSKGKIMALCEKEITAAVRKRENTPVPNGDPINKYRLIVKDKSYPPHSKAKEENFIRIKESKLRLPFYKEISLVKEVLQPVKYKSVTYNYGDFKKKALKIIDNKQRKEEIFDVVSYSLKEQSSDEFFFLTKRINYIKDIAQTREI